MRFGENSWRKTQGLGALTSANAATRTFDDLFGDTMP